MNIWVFRNDDSLERVKKGLYLALNNLELSNPKQIAITNYKQDKTEEQRNSFHLLCKLFGDELGYTINEIKELVKGEVLDTTIVNIAGREREVTRSSESLKRDEYSALIESTYRLASEAGIQLPPLMR